MHYTHVIWDVSSLLCLCRRRTIAIHQVISEAAVASPGDQCTTYDWVPHVVYILFFIDCNTLVSLDTITEKDHNVFNSRSIAIAKYS